MPKPTSKSTPRKLRSPITPEGSLNQMISLAYDLARNQLRDGSASSQTINHFLNLGSPKAKHELEILQEQKKLIKAKTAQLESARNFETMLGDAMKAWSRYSGKRNEMDEEDEDV